VKRHFWQRIKEEGGAKKHSDFSRAKVDAFENESNFDDAQHDAGQTSVADQLPPTFLLIDQSHINHILDVTTHTQTSPWLTAE
jgi:hypothetical protein